MGENRKHAYFIRPYSSIYCSSEIPLSNRHVLFVSRDLIQSVLLAICCRKSAHWSVLSIRMLCMISMVARFLSPRLCIVVSFAPACYFMSNIQCYSETCNTTVFIWLLSTSIENSMRVCMLRYVLQNMFGSCCSQHTLLTCSACAICK